MVERESAACGREMNVGHINILVEAKKMIEVLYEVLNVKNTHVTKNPYGSRNDPRMFSLDLNQSRNMITVWLRVRELKDEQ